jgi:hypothetical protein
MHPAKFILAKDKLADGSIFPPIAIVPSLNMSMPSAKITKRIIDLMMEAVRTSETLFYSNVTTRRYITESSKKASVWMD